jgi:acetoacetate decarboxylase
MAAPGISREFVMDAKVRKKAAPKPFKSPFGYAMPHLSPLYTPPPFEYRDAHSMMIVFESDPKVLARYVPKPLVIDPKATMFAQISRFFTAGFGSYHEILLAAHAHFQGRPVNYSLSLILDNDIAICGGREIWGFPKKLGRVTLSDKDGVMSGTVERGGLPLVRGAMQIGDICSPGELAGSAEYVQLKMIPSVRNGAPPEVMQLASTTLRNVVMKDVFKGPATLEFFPSPVDRFCDIPIARVIGGYLYRADFTLEDGEVIHDYLTA